MKIRTTLVDSYLDSVQIVPYNLKEDHPKPADVLSNDSEALFSLFRLYGKEENSIYFVSLKSMHF